MDIDFDLDLDDMTEMYMAGQLAANEGLGKQECPVAPNHPRWSNWQLGWADAKAALGRLDGSMHRNTMDARAKVTAQMGVLKDYQPDPVDAILGVDEPDLGGIKVKYVMSIPTPPSWVKDAIDQLYDNLTRPLFQDSYTPHPLTYGVDDFFTDHLWTPDAAMDSSFALLWSGNLVIPDKPTIAKITDITNCRCSPSSAPTWRPRKRGCSTPCCRARG